jgi:hypothetical protein
MAALVALLAAYQAHLITPWHERWATIVPFHDMPLPLGEKGRAHTGVENGGPAREGGGEDDSSLPPVLASFLFQALSFNLAMKAFSSLTLLHPLQGSLLPCILY